MKPHVSPKRFYDAAKPSDFHTTPDTSTSADRVVNHAGSKLRDYARWLDENSDIAIGILDVLVNNIVGGGINIEPQVADRKGALLVRVNTRIRELWGQWKRRPEITGELSMEELQRLSCRTWVRDGEMLVEHVQGPVNANRRRVVPYCVRALEPDWLPFNMNSNTPRIVHGVEKDGDGIPTNYHFYQDLGDPLFAGFGFQTKTRVVPAARVQHLKFMRRLNQTRGVTILHGVINRLHDIKELEEAERVASQVAASFTAAITRNPDMVDLPDAAGSTEDSSSDLDRDRNRFFELAPGAVWDNLLPGEDVKGIGLERPNSNLADFLADQHRRLAAGVGASYSSISKRYDGTYSSQRQELVESAPGYARMRTQFISDFLQPIYERFLEWAVESGALAVPKSVTMDGLRRADYRAPGMPWIDPKKEIEADALAVQAGFKSRHVVIRERGYDPEIIDQQIAEDTFVPATATPTADQEDE